VVLWFATTAAAFASCPAPPPSALLAVAVTVDWGWMVTYLGAQVVVGLAAGAVGAYATLRVMRTEVDRLKADSGEQAQAIEELRDRLSEIATSSIVHDKRLETAMAAGFVPRDDCRAYRAEHRQTATRLFAKIEALQQEQARGNQAIEDLRATVTAAVAAREN